MRLHTFGSGKCVVFGSAQLCFQKPGNLFPRDPFAAKLRFSFQTNKQIARQTNKENKINKTSLFKGTNFKFREVCHLPFSSTLLGSKCRRMHRVTLLLLGPDFSFKPISKQTKQISLFQVINLGFMEVHRLPLSSALLGCTV